MGLEFGIFDHSDMRAETLGKTFAERIRFAQAAEAAGFRSYHLALQPAFGDIGHVEEIRSLDRFAGSVMPQLRKA